MKYLVTFLLTTLISTSSFGKDDFTLTVYHTYEDYQNKKGEQLYEFIGYDWTMGSLHLHYKIKKRNEGKVKVTTAYGFSVGEQFYRVIKGRPYRVLMQGKAVYYENGIAHLNMLIGDENSSDVELGGYSFISMDLTSEIIEFPSSKADNEFKDQPALQPLWECMKKLKKRKTDKIRKCVKENI